MSKNILVIDDDPVIRTLVADCLVCFGHTVDSASCGKEGLQKLSGVLPDIVILDLQMPDIPGTEVLRVIRTEDRTRALTVIMLSANESSRGVSEEPNIRADLYLQKPFDLKELLRKVEELNP